MVQLATSKILKVSPCMHPYRVSILNTEIDLVANLYEKKKKNLQTDRDRHRWILLHVSVI